MKRILAVIAIACAITGTVTAPSSASTNGTTADPPAFNNRTLFLSNHPTDSMATACWDRPILLRTGFYDWFLSWEAQRWDDLPGSPADRPGGRYLHVEDLC